MAGSFAIAVPLAVGVTVATPPSPGVDYLWEPDLNPVFNAINVQPGEIIEIKAGVYQGNNFSIENLAGSLLNRIIVRNELTANEPVIFEHTGNNTEEFFRVLDCQHFDFDGTNKYVGAPLGNLGIDVINNVWQFGRTQAGIIFRQEINNTTPPTGYVVIAGNTQDCTFRGFELDGAMQIAGARPGIGFQAFDRLRFQKANQFDLLFRDNIVVEKFYIHGTGQEGYSLGNNWANTPGQGPPAGSALDADPRNCHLRYGIVEDCAWSGGEIKGAWDDSIGRSSIHHVASFRNGQIAASINDPNHANGLQSTGSQCDLHNNFVVESGGDAIATRVQQMDIGVGIAECFYQVFNNVAIRPGLSGINAWHTAAIANSNTGFDLAVNRTDIFNNTVIDAPASDGSLRYTGSNGEARNNLLAGNGVGGSGSIETETVGPHVGSFADINNRLSTIAVADFLDAANDDYHLTTNSPAHDANAINFPSDDHVDISRPRGNSADQGAFEFIEPSAARNILVEMTFAQGFLSSSVNQDVDGVYRDFGFIFGLEKWGPSITITEIENTNPAIVHFTGSIVDPVSSGSVDHDDMPPIYTLEEVPSGMTQVSQRYFGFKNISNLNGGTAELFQNGDDSGYNPNEDQTCPTPTDATGYGTWTGQVQAETFKKYESRSQQLDGNDGNPSKIVTAGFIPPPTRMGIADPVEPLEGDKILGMQIGYWQNHDRTDAQSSGTWQPKDKPRSQWLMHSSPVRVASNQTTWWGWSVLLPSNYDNITNTNNNNDRSKIEMFQCKQSSGGGLGNNVWTLNISHPDNEDSEWWTCALRTHNLVETDGFQLSSMAGDIGLWTSFVVEFKEDISSGVFRIWKSDGPYIGNTLERNMILVRETLGDVGMVSINDGWTPTCGMYKFAWHRTTTVAHPLMKFIWIGFNSMRWGGENTEGTGYSDVHPFRSAQP